MKVIYKTLLAIQTELKCPKDLFNKFGNYNYRNAETILENVKPLCAKHNCVLTLSDTIVNIGERYYVCAEAVLTDVETGDYVSNKAFAREDENRKGMDGSQVTGSCSSYARKYALNGLFCLDDVKDADTDEQREEIENKSKATDGQINYICKLYKAEELDAMLSRMGKTLGDITKEEAQKMINARKENK